MECDSIAESKKSHEKIRVCCLFLISIAESGLKMYNHSREKIENRAYLDTDRPLSLADPDGRSVAMSRMVKQVGSRAR